MIFILLLFITTLAIAGAAAFFSVIGLSQIFSVTALFWASSLEAGKLIAASFIYRYWDKMRFLMKIYLIVAVVGLMIITSLGIAGHLIADYQADAIDLTSVNERIELLQNEDARLKQRLDSIDEYIANIPLNFVTRRLQTIDSFKPEQDQIISRMNEISSEILVLNIQKLDTEAKVGPIMYVAQTFGYDPNQAVFILIILIVFVFDPLAIALTIATNMAILERKKEMDRIKLEQQTQSLNDDVPVDIDDIFKDVDFDIGEASDKSLDDMIGEMLKKEEGTLELDGTQEIDYKDADVYQDEIPVSENYEKLMGRLNELLEKVTLTKEEAEERRNLSELLKQFMHRKDITKSVRTQKDFV